MRAFHSALDSGADGLECDLRLTADGHLVLFHDDDLKRLCGTKGAIEEMQLSDVNKLLIFQKERIPTLSDFLHEFHTATLNLEIKKTKRPEVVVEAVLRELTKIRPAGRIVISSFCRKVLEALAMMDPQRKNAGLGILCESSEIEFLPEWNKNFNASTWNVPRQILNAPWSKRWKNVDIPPIWVWTLDEADQWQAVLRNHLPFEAVITNKPASLVAYLSSLPPTH
jgi:glycerophosphoryl diester phosphodiesterase